MLLPWRRCNSTCPDRTRMRWRDPEPMPGQPEAHAGTCRRRLCRGLAGKSDLLRYLPIKSAQLARRRRAFVQRSRPAILYMLLLIYALMPRLVGACDRISKEVSELGWTGLQAAQGSFQPTTVWLGVGGRARGDDGEALFVASGLAEGIPRVAWEEYGMDMRWTVRARCAVCVIISN